MQMDHTIVTLVLCVSMTLCPSSAPVKADLRGMEHHVML